MFKLAISPTKMTLEIKVRLVLQSSGSTLSDEHKDFQFGAEKKGFKAF